MFGNVCVANNFFRRAFDRLTLYWSRLEVPRRFCFEVPPTFSYCIGDPFDRESPWWVMEYTEISIKTAALIFLEVYDSCRLWALNREMIQEIRRLILEKILGNTGNVREFLSLFEAIGGSKFREFLARWSCGGMLPILSPGHTGGGVDYRFYKPFSLSFISEGEATVFLSVMDRILPPGDPVGWDYSEIDENFDGSNQDLARLRALLRCWGDVSDSSRDKVEVKSEVEASEKNLKVLPRVITDDVKTVRKYLRRVGEIHESVISGWYEALVAYLQGCLH